MPVRAARRRRPAASLSNRAQVTAQGHGGWAAAAAAGVASSAAAAALQPAHQQQQQQQQLAGSGRGGRQAPAEHHAGAAGGGYGLRAPAPPSQVRGKDFCPRVADVSAWSASNAPERAAACERALGFPPARSFVSAPPRIHVCTSGQRWPSVRDGRGACSTRCAHGPFSSPRVARVRARVWRGVKEEAVCLCAPPGVDALPPRSRIARR